MNIAIRIIASLIVLLGIGIGVLAVIRWVNTPPGPYEVREWVEKGDLTAVDRALKRGFDVDDGLAELLKTAIDSHNVEMVALLLRHKANPNIKIFPNRSPLSRALDENQTEIVKRLLEAGGDADFRIPVDTGTVSLLWLARVNANSHDNPELYTLIKNRVKVDTTALDDATMKLKSPKIDTSVPECFALSRYAEAKGHSFWERAMIVDDARKRGACR